VTKGQGKKKNLTGQAKQDERGVSYLIANGAKKEKEVTRCGEKAADRASSKGYSASDQGDKNQKKVFKGREDVRCRPTRSASPLEV